MLFGEYLLLFGGDALAVPYTGRFGEWAWHESQKPNEAQLQLMDFAASEQAKTVLGNGQQRFQSDLNNGLYFKSNIPTGYGAGSSGALTAAVYDRYCTSSKSELLELKRDLAQLEGFFHGSSSGIDPLTSYCRAPIFLEKNTLKKLENLPLQWGDYKLFLVDTEMPRSTEPLVIWFKNELQNVDFQFFMQKELLPLSNAALHSFLEKKETAFLQSLRELSFHQFAFLKKLIPAAYQSTWEKGLRTDDFYMKLCGAGGGGFLLVWVKKGKENALPKAWNLINIVNENS